MSDFGFEFGFVLVALPLLLEPSSIRYLFQLSYLDYLHFRVQWVHWLAQVNVTLELVGRPAMGHCYISNLGLDLFVVSEAMYSSPAPEMLMCCPCC